MGTQFLLFLYLTFSVSAAFIPQDNYLLSCGTSNVTVFDGRTFVGDLSRNGSAYLAAEGKSTIPIKDSNKSGLYSTARVFTSASGYKFEINKLGTHLVRFHLAPFTSSQDHYDLKNANFDVSANGILLLRSFRTQFTVLKEFILMVDKSELEIMFKPVKDDDFAFVNAIEVFSAPNDFFVDVSGGTAMISPNGKIQEFKENMSSQVLETVHRINVGGSKVTPFNDTLWRTWIPDEEYLVLKSAAKRVETSHPPNYQKGGASRDIAPDKVYMTAQEMNTNGTVNFMFNITWSFPVGSGYMHFVRLHFCDIVSPALNSLYFNVYINGATAYKDLDLSSLTFHQLASPYYIDFVVDMVKNSDVLHISVGPSVLSNTLRKNAILNGVEIMRMVNNVMASETTWSKKKWNWVLIGSIIGGFFAMCLALSILLAILRCRKKRPKRKTRQNSESTGWMPLRVYAGPSSHGTVLSSPGSNGLRIPFADIELATNNFDKTLLIGSGGFGMVYKGVLRDNTKVAVKRGMRGSRQGLPEFQTEITVLSKIRHRHLVSMVGYCEENSEMILVYEFMEKGPLRHHLYGNFGYPTLSWKQRLDICIGAARGLHYLHTGSATQGGIIHRDIKSTNILIDENYVAKVADFGLSRSGPCLDETHVSTGVKGSFGYLDPEYFRRQQLTDKSDVYSFGVLLFEVLCARPAIDPLLEREQVNLAEWAMEWQKKGRIEEIMDQRLKDEMIVPSSLRLFGETAEKCLGEYGVDRPSMGDVLWNLEHVLQLQMKRIQPQDQESTDVVASDEPRIVPGVLSSNGVSDDGASDITTSRVFSQLITNEGR